MISVKEYINNKDLLEMNYVPYEQKVEVCDVIMSQVTNNIGYDKIDSVMLERVCAQVFIENLTNIDFSIKDDNELEGYDILCFYNELDELINKLPEYKRMEHMMKLKVEDFYKNQGSLRGYINSIINSISHGVNELKKLLEAIDTKDVSDKIISYILYAKENLLEDDKSK